MTGIWTSVFIYASTYLKVSAETVMSDDPPCGLDVALAVIGGKWKPLILFHLQSGPRRFGDLRRRVAGVSEKVLIQQLRELVTVGVITRHDHQQLPPVVDYTMTTFGMTLVRALMPLCAWGIEHRAEVEEIMTPSAPNAATMQASNV